MEILHAFPPQPPRVQAALFDFDGTISTLRAGWETVMRRLMLEWLGAGELPDRGLLEKVDAYIDESTGIQTIHQMKWLAAEIENAGKIQGAPTDPWFYKAEYNRRLMKTVAMKREAVASGRADREKYLIAGAEAFLRALKERGVRLYVASGTDHPDVLREVQALGLSGFFDSVAGAPLGEENCSKEAVMNRLIREERLCGEQVAVIGDGKVEIALGKAACARTIGMATDEAARKGVDEVKRRRLIKAGADAICGDFSELADMLAFLGL